VLARVQILMGFAALATLPAYHLSFDAMQQAMAWLPRTETGYLGYNVVGYLISASVMVPASFCAGMTLPLLTSVLYSRGRGESEIGAVYGWNTLGGIAGVALGSLVLMPLVGLKNLLVIGACIDIALGFALAGILVWRKELSALPWTAALAAAAMVAVVATLFAFELDLTRMASTVFRHGKARIDATSKVVFHADGRTASVDLIAGQNGAVSITTNGKPDAAINMARLRGNRSLPVASDEVTMTMLAALPLAYRPEARRAAIIGHGSGLTTHVLLASPAIERADVVEIEPEMIRGARAFGPRVSRAYNDPRVRYHIDDARAFFARTPQQYDIVISEPSNPWVSGVASLFTPEFYRLARRSLVPGGLFVQWLQLYEFDRAQTAAVIRGLGEIFPDYVLYVANSADLIIVATAPGPMPALSEAIFGWRALRTELDHLDIHTPEQFAATRIASRRGYAPLLEIGAPNTDYHPSLEFGAARARFLESDDQAVVQIARDPVPVLEILSGFTPSQRTDYPPQAGRHSDRYSDLRRANWIADALLAGRADAADSAMLAGDRANVERALRVPRLGTPADWDDWFDGVFALARRMFPNGEASAIEKFLRSPNVVAALRTAPPAIGEKIEFMLLVGARDLARIRSEGARWVETANGDFEPGFSLYVLVATSTACLATPTLDAVCRNVLAKLEQVQRKSPVIGLLRAHRDARG
jgi:spermidine synthase